MELYDQVEEKLYETRKYFVTYKMLERTKVFLEKEVCRQGSIARVQRNTSNSTLLLIPVALLCVCVWGGHRSPSFTPSMTTLSRA